MRFLANIAWLVLGGLLTSVLYILAGILCCVTVIGIPFGSQLFKIGCFAFWPFGHELAFREGQPGCLSIVFNLLWILLGWWEIALIHAACGLIFCVTIVGIPFGLKHFQIALTSLFPFGQSNFSRR